MGFGVNFGKQFEQPQENFEANLASAMARLQETLPSENNTYERDGKYFAMGLEVSPQGYNEFMKKYEEILETLSKAE